MVYRRQMEEYSMSWNLVQLAMERRMMQLLFKKEDEGRGLLSANLRAPLLINVRDRIGLQKVMEHMEPKLMLSNLASRL